MHVSPKTGLKLEGTETCERFRARSWVTLTSSRGERRAPISAQLADKLACVVLRAAFSGSTLDSFGRSDPAGSSSRTSPAERLAGSTLSGKSWKTKDMQRYRSRLAQDMSALLIEDSGPSSSDAEWTEWPTPTASSSEHRTRKPTPGDASNGGKRGRRLSGEAIARSNWDSSEWPTPAANDAKAHGWGRHKTAENASRHSGTTLTDATVRYPASPSPGLPPPTTKPDGEPTSRSAVLHSRFVEALQGFPRGFVVPPCEPSETPSSPGKPPSSDE